MPFVPVPDAAEVELIYLLDGQRVENTLGFFHGDGYDVSNLQQLAAIVEGWWVAEMAPTVSEDISLLEVVATSLETENSPSVTEPAAPPVSGEVLGSAAPNNVTLAIAFRTTLRGRSFRGRNYVAGIPLSSVFNSRIDPNAVANWVAAYNTLRTTAAVDGHIHSVLSRFSGVDANGNPIPRTQGLATPVTAAVAVDNTVDSQRRRLPGRGT